MGGFFLLFLFDFSEGLKKDPSIIPSNLIAEKVPNLSLLPIKQYPLFLRKNLVEDNKTVKIVNFFASWCPPCKVEHPQLLNLSKNNKIFGIAKKDSENQVDKWLKKSGNPFEKLGLDNSGLTSIEWGVYGLPETFIIDKNATIRHKHIGPIQEKDLYKIKKIIEDLE